MHNTLCIDYSQPFPRTPFEFSESYHGKMINISANGFALQLSDTEIINRKGSMISVTIDDFNLGARTELEGYIIRVTDNDGNYIVGCRMLDDDMFINDYVEKVMTI